MTSAPFFSVIVPTHKRPSLLRRALRSIRSQEASVPFEAIVVSDHRDTETDVVCSEELTAADTYVRRSGLPGPSASRNLAMLLAKGVYILFLDDDDAWYPRCLAQLLDQDAVRRGLPIYFNCSVVTERRPGSGPEFISEIELDLKGKLTNEVYVKNQIHISCYALPRHILEGLKFDAFLRAYEDWDFLLSVYERAPPIHVPILGSRAFEVSDNTTDRRGSSAQANNFHAVMDYMYIYHRHPAPCPEIAQKRAELLQTCGVSISRDFL